ncbi:chemotaxis protein CheA [Peribacillus saganii]|uniref:Chemotaxis protein CheA n=1 Tax=Peribacillus saganii TaxID=2303992 RepID=A0A372LT72_9BACI|nr:chemotaxis protein CheA [Peribacillus saganii]RFU71000.1 chemotaxis protein CheA [Peribacillus saganii]
MIETNNQYFELFLEESTEHLQAVNDHLLKLEEQPGNIEIVGEIFRSAHTLKGMSATMGYTDIADLTHHMENVLDLIRNKKLSVTTAVVDLIFESVESLEGMVDSIRNGGDGKRDVSSLVRMLEQMGKGEAIEAIDLTSSVQAETIETSDYEKTVISHAIEQGFETYQISVKLDDDCALKIVRVFMVFEALEILGDIIKSVPAVESLENEEFDTQFQVLLISKANKEEIENNILQVSEVKEVTIVTYNVDQSVHNGYQGTEKNDVETNVSPEQSSKSSNSSNPAASKTIRVNIERIDQLMNLFEELIIDRGRLEDISSTLMNSELSETVEKMVRVSSDLQTLILEMRMVPVEQVFNRFPRMVRGLAKDLEKQISLEIMGAETELDRTVIDEIGDPLVHLIRNSLDHGIEKPEVRKEKGKDPEGKVILKAFHSGNHVFIEIEDDGGGINRDIVLKKAIQNGIVQPENADKLTDDQVYQLIFASGFSTAEQISDISGRGVGLDVVKTKIESLGGAIFIESQLGRGTRFSIQLPLTLSILSAMLVKVEEETYAIPLSSILETATVKKEDVMKAHGQEVIDFRGKVVPLVLLQEILQVPKNYVGEVDHYSIVVVKKGDKMTALAVNSFIGQKEIVLKSLGNYLKNVYAISGATILGNGNIALILDTNDLVK